jgi:regulator of RNase E activity RraB
MRTILVGLFVLIPIACSPTTEPSSQLPEERAVIAADVLARQRLKDQQVVRALANAGSDLSKPHALEHHFVCPNRAAAEPVVAWGRAAGYEPSPVSDGEFKGRRYAYFDLVKKTVPTMANITPQTTAMLEVAAKHAIEYDGWGCRIER